MEAAASALENVKGAIGAEPVAAAIEGVVVSGELPSELPSGATQEQVSTIVAGFTTQANAVLKETGVTVDALNEMLDDGELREARRAVYLNDDDALRALGAKAIRLLETLPDNAAEFKALTHAFPAEVRVHRKNGEAWVTTPKWNMSWSRAVRTGKIKF